MLIGILSDSHGDAVATRLAIELLRERGATQFFHCGDICGEAVLDELAACHATRFVWGNCDHPSPTLRKYVRDIGLAPPEVPVLAEIDGKSIAVYHGHERPFFLACLKPATDYIFHGHTHVFADNRAGRCRIINPGALYRARVKTVALLNPSMDDLQFLRLEDGERVRMASGKM